MSLWYYDTLDLRAGSFAPFDVRSTDTSQVLGLGAYWGDPNYEVRILYDATGSPNWISTNIRRSAGWHHFELFQYRQPGSDAVDFYIDGARAYHETGIKDATLNRVVLGFGWAPNIYQSGYVDDILVTTLTVPEPGVASLVVVGALIAIGRRKSYPDGGPTRTGHARSFRVTRVQLMFQERRALVNRAFTRRSLTTNPHE